MSRYDVVVQKRGYRNPPPHGAIVGVIVQVEADDEIEAAKLALADVNPLPADVLAPGPCGETVVMPMEAEAWEPEYHGDGA